eukprot:TRINITY_DN4897_c0_g1_i1.p1 TRINITY_DN4897_c0_g1~~TRINITY_DN4897_c0_g1_i1.p1  ORF type:complete len:186 (+),score=45.18 TRINITY_DN4897_c0_g1_i1:26-559(+)
MCIRDSHHVGQQQQQQQQLQSQQNQVSPNLLPQHGSQLPGQNQGQQQHPGQVQQPQQQQQQFQQGQQQQQQKQINPLYPNPSQQQQQQQEKQLQQYQKRWEQFKYIVLLLVFKDQMTQENLKQIQDQIQNFNVKFTQYKQKNMRIADNTISILRINKMNYSEVNDKIQVTVELKQLN